MAVSPFIFPFTISVLRQATVSTIGEVSGYSGARSSTETVVASGLPANIDLSGKGGVNESDMPGNARFRGTYRIYIPLDGGGVRTLGIKRGDIIKDDSLDGSGARYQVASPHWNSCGWQLDADRVEV